MVFPPDTDTPGFENENKNKVLHMLSLKIFPLWWYAYIFGFPVKMIAHGCLLSNSNWTEWSTIQGVIAQVISKSDEREADKKSASVRRP